MCLGDPELIRQNPKGSYGLQASYIGINNVGIVMYGLIMKECLVRCIKRNMSLKR